MEVEDVRPTPVVGHQMPVPSPEPVEVEMETSPGSVPPSVEVEGTFPSGSAQQQPETQVEYVRRFKRKAETEREELEKEIREDTNAMLKDNEEFYWFWMGSGEPVFLASLGALEGPASFTPATAPEMCSGSLDSVCFNPGNEHEFVKMRLGGRCLGLETR